MPPLTSITKSKCHYFFFLTKKKPILLTFRIYESGVCELAELSGKYTENNTLAAMSWKCRPPTETELERWTTKYQTKIEKKNECEAENAVQDNVRMPKVR